MSAALPNILTALRLVAVPVMVLLLLADDGAEGPDRWWGLLVFLIAGATDFLDGYLARRWAVVSTFGKLADPIADKVLILAALAMISLIDGIGWWALIVLALREIAVTVGRLMVAGDTVIAASQGGKIKTALQVVAITLFLWPNAAPWVDVVAYVLLVAAVLLALVTGYDYMRRIVAARRHQRATEGGHQGSRPDVAA
ncbi:CDP-diacylglycerol--glycerol-3-phosphate 3-phosphatidyltransferase [Demequina oxidasica]|uniref:CDP-diacylglycerol--glycerol-3-phosphate 3-phosphatidyltransferase n=1 Tax=Demequina oxidasica TaxID=676199 RepID=UPI000780742B|nr:CDP-diacylglycerol--glycerol-3-phosphate 3-phosphatidyltransferase [Demequina oxidasica]